MTGHGSPVSSDRDRFVVQPVMGYKYPGHESLTLCDRDRLVVQPVYSDARGLVLTNGGVGPNERVGPGQ